MVCCSAVKPPHCSRTEAESVWLRCAASEECGGKRDLDGASVGSPPPYLPPSLTPSIIARSCRRKGGGRHGEAELEMGQPRQSGSRAMSWTRASADSTETWSSSDEERKKTRIPCCPSSKKDQRRMCRRAGQASVAGKEKSTRLNRR